MAGFDEVRFPIDISYKSTGGPRRRTEIAALGSGAEERNSVWADSRREYNAGYGVKSHDDLHAVIVFFEARLARARGFRFKDWGDFKSCPPLQTVAPADQNIGTGDGSNAAFQLTKSYSSGGQVWSRAIKKPVAGTMRVAVAGVEKTLAVDFTVSTATGVVTFLPGHIPGAGQAVTAGFEFDVPVRFDTDFLNVNMSTFEAGEIPDIPIIELKI